MSPASRSGERQRKSCNVPSERTRSNGRLCPRGLGELCLAPHPLATLIDIRDEKWLSCIVRKQPENGEDVSGKHAGLVAANKEHSAERGCGEGGKEKEKGQEGENASNADSPTENMKPIILHEKAPHEHEYWKVVQARRGRYSKRDTRIPDESNIDTNVTTLFQTNVPERDATSTNASFHSNMEAFGGLGLVLLKGMHAYCSVWKRPTYRKERQVAFSV